MYVCRTRWLYGREGKERKGKERKKVLERKVCLVDDDDDDGRWYG